MQAMIWAMPRAYINRAHITSVRHSELYRSLIGQIYCPENSLLVVKPDSNERVFLKVQQRKIFGCQILGTLFSLSLSWAAWDDDIGRVEFEVYWPGLQVIFCADLKSWFNHFRNHVVFVSFINRLAERFANWECVKTELDKIIWRSSRGAFICTLEHGNGVLIQTSTRKKTYKIKGLLNHSPSCLIFEIEASNSCRKVTEQHFWNELCRLEEKYRDPVQGSKSAKVYSKPDQRDRSPKPPRRNPSRQCRKDLNYHH